MLHIDESAISTIAELGKALAMAFTVSDGDRPADPDWEVYGLITRAWKVNHPQLPVVKTAEGSTKDVLLQLQVTRDGDSGKWLVIAKNNVVMDDPQASPRMRVIFESNESPGTWNLDLIAKEAANWFYQQKLELEKKAQSLVDEKKTRPGAMSQGGPPAPPGGMPPGGAPPMGPPIASRRERLRKGILRDL
jgi:hypothetical protein